MNREVKFRGKEDGGGWFYGFLTISKSERHAICFQTDSGEWCDIRVIPETVGQFTGLYDNNGKEIYEGDFVKLAEGVFVIRFIRACFGFRKASGQRYDVGNFNNVEVLGSIHDNPELLKTENNH